MYKFLRIAGISLWAVTLSACFYDGTSRGPYFWDSLPEEDTPLYPEGYDSNYGSNGSNRGSKTVVVPESYHLGASNSPVASKDADRQWVDTQSPNGYTIQIAHDQKPAPVAKKLYKAPKTERSAEVKSQSGSYLGLYGSYPTREAAESQLNALPDDLKNNAQIKHWGIVQHEIN
ncbi:MAG: SPOR domain-containing protein [Gammaproteobacteria bacterium]|nr:SPOR domain-containing protein [Gammaproteobacteria bacterium]